MPLSFFYFDLGNVLLHFSRDQACRQMGKVAGVAADKIRQVVFDTDLETRFERGEIDEQTFYEEFCAATGTRPDFAELEQAGSDIFTVNKLLLPVVGGLEVTNRRIGIISNTNPSHWRHVVAHGHFNIVTQIFNHFVLSYEVGAIKPEPAIFAAATERANVPPDEIFFVDDLASHVEAARQYGWDAVQFTSSGQLMRDLYERGVRINC